MATRRSDIQTAASYFYQRARWLSLLRLTILVALALIPIAASGDATLAAWAAVVLATFAILDRLYLVEQRERWQVQGALAQEQYDVDLFSIPWNDALGLQVEASTLEAAARRARAVPSDPWYSTDPSPIAAVAACQLENATWSQWIQRNFRLTLSLGTLIVLALGIGTAVARGLTVVDYALTLWGPSIPAIISVVDRYQLHSQSESEWSTISNRLRLQGSPNIVVTRATQDLIFRARCNYEFVPRSFYWLAKRWFEG